jgi:hypothetical protein
VKLAGRLATFFPRDLLAFNSRMEVSKVRLAFPDSWQT